MKSFAWVSVLLISACGTQNKTCQEDKSKCEASTLPADGEKFFYLRGSVVGAFDVEVDGQHYSDMESFYSEESAKLTSKAIAAGYVGYTAKLEGKIGFKDLTEGMSVFIAPSTKHGYAAKTVVAYDDTFSVRFPEEAAHDIYKVRATKRINIKLTRPKPQAQAALIDEVETKLLCYNFSAIELSVSYDESNQPIILSSFETKLTNYTCQDAQTDETLAIPNTIEGK